MLWLLPIVAVSLVGSHAFGLGPAWSFALAALGIVPLADLVRRATEALARRSGRALGGLLNVTFGNAPDLIIAAFLLRQGQPSVVKAQLAGAIIANSLLGLGLASVVGAARRPYLQFDKEEAGHLSSLLVLTMVALTLPAVFKYTHPTAAGESLSLGVAGVLLVVYVASLVYVLVTHREVFAACDDETGTAHPAWPLWRSLGTLVVATALIAGESEIVSETLGGVATALGLGPAFLGVVVLAIVGGLSEYVSAVTFAAKGRMGLVLNVTVGSTIQIALFVAPVLVFFSYAIGQPMNLVFTDPLELVGIAAVAFGVSSVAHDGRVTWFEGVLALALYVLFALAFFFSS